MIAIDEKITQKKPAKATVVNLGVSFLHLKDTEKTEKPIEAVRPNTNPITVSYTHLTLPTIYSV